VGKNVIAVIVSWQNEDIISGKKAIPTYRVSVTDSTQNEISFRLLFDDPSQVSRGQKADQVQIEVLNPSFIIRQNDLTTLGSSTSFVGQLSRQLEIPN
jgi:hypothetical protein